MENDTLGLLLEAIRAEERDKVEVEFRSRFEGLESMEKESTKYIDEAKRNAQVQTERAEAMRDRLLGVAARLELFAQELTDSLQ